MAHRAMLLAAAVAAVAVPEASAAAVDPTVMLAKIKPLIDADYPRVEAVYKDIHQHPELAFQEVRTAALLAAQMRALGFTVTEKVGRTGIVAVYRNGAGPSVMVRTELDALPMEEKTGLPYASRVQAVWPDKPGSMPAPSAQARGAARATATAKDVTTYVAHSCGHDIHMAAWLETATTLLATKADWRGTLMFIAQPAEEQVEGAKAMLDDGLFTRFGKPTYAFALHASPAPAGTVGLKSGVTTSAGTAVEVTIVGRGGHGAMPSSTIDPIVIGAHFVTDIQTVISREKDPATFGVISVGAFNAGTAGNIIPDSALLKLTVRSFDAKVQQALIDGVKRTAAAASAMARAPAARVDVLQSVDPMVNDSALADRTAVVVKAALGPRFTYIPASGAPASASEDFSVFPEAGVPSLFFWIGATDPRLVEAAKRGGPPVPVNHSPYFAPVPEPTIKAGATAMTLAVLGVMAPD